MVWVGVSQVIGLIFFYQGSLCQEADEVITVNDWFLLQNLPATHENPIPNGNGYRPLTELKDNENSSEMQVSTTMEPLAETRPLALQRLSKLQILGQNHLRRLCVRYYYDGGGSICAKVNTGRLKQNNKIDYWNFVQEALHEKLPAPGRCPRYSSYMWAWKFLGTRSLFNAITHAEDINFRKYLTWFQIAGFTLVSSFSLISYVYHPSLD